MRRIYTLIIVLLISNGSFARTNFEETDLLKSAYQAIFDLKLDKAKELLETSKQQDADNYLVYHIENYIDFIQLFIGEDEGLYEKLLVNRSIRLELIKKADNSSPYYLFSQAEIKLQWAILAAKFGYKFRAGKEAYSAYAMLLDNDSKFPEFLLNRKTLSAFHALSESLPSWLQFILNIDGSIKQGIYEIKSIVSHSKSNKFLFDEESTAIYALILLHFDDKKEEAWEVLENSNFDPSTSPVATFLMSNIAKKLGRNDRLIDLLSNKPIGEGRYPFYYLDYLLGKAKLNRLDKDANIHILYFLHHFDGQHYIKEAYQKLAWYELVVNDNFPGYKKYMELCESNGHEVLGSDIQAQKEASGNKVPNPNLLRARLYFDGGYFHKSYQILIKNSFQFEENPIHQLEYFYRLGRVTELLKNYTDAINFYLKVIDIGSDKPEYYACKSAYQLGNILEREKRFKQAIHFYKICIDLEPIEYKNEIHSQAKAGLDRITNR